MAREHAISRFQQFPVAGEIPVVKRPVGVIVQFLEPLIESINGQEESFGIGDVNGHRHFEGCAGFPHEVEMRIVNFHQRAGSDLFPKIEAQSFHHFQSFSPCLMRAGDLVRLPSRVIWAAKVVPSRLREDHEPVGVRPLKALKSFLKALSTVPGQVHHHPDVFLIHHRQHVVWRGKEPYLLSDGYAILVPRPHGEMGVNINDGKARTRHIRFRHVKHALGLEVLQCKPLRLGGLRRLAGFLALGRCASDCHGRHSRGADTTQPLPAINSAHASSRFFLHLAPLPQWSVDRV